MIGPTRKVVARHVDGTLVKGYTYDFAPERREGRRVQVVFKDNEVLVGAIYGNTSSQPGLFVTPADPASNNIRVSAPSTAIRQVRFLVADPPPTPPTPAVRGPVVEPALPERLLAWLLEPLRVPRVPVGRRVHP
jgi:Family of unknown function (DUF6982)